MFLEDMAFSAHDTKMNVNKLKWNNELIRAAVAAWCCVCWLRLT